MSNDAILTHRHDKIAIVELNRPNNKNALNPETRSELKAAIHAVAIDKDIRAVVITGAGSAFCSGGDLSAVGKVTHPRSITWSLMHDVQPTLECIARMDKPVIAAVNGPAIGFGMSLALACDLMVMDENAYLLSQFIRLGLIPDGGAAWYLAHRIGYARMFEIIADAGKIDSNKAVNWGIANRATEKGQALENAVAWAHKLSHYAPTGMRLTKRLAHLAQSSRLEESLQLEAEFQSICTQSDDMQEAVSAFLEKREPNFET